MMSLDSYVVFPPPLIICTSKKNVCRKEGNKRDFGYRSRNINPQTSSLTNPPAKGNKGKRDYNMETFYQNFNLRKTIISNNIEGYGITDIISWPPCNFHQSPGIQETNTLLATTHLAKHKLENRNQYPPKDKWWSCKSQFSTHYHRKPFHFISFDLRNPI